MPPCCRTTFSEGGYNPLSLSRDASQDGCSPFETLYQSADIPAIRGKLDMYPQQGYADIVIKRVLLGKRARKQLKKVPKYVAEKLAGWVSTVEEMGVEDARKIPGYHDEPLLGARKGQRSIRLSISYRAIYEIEKDIRDGDEPVEFVSVNEVTKHEY